MEEEESEAEILPLGKGTDHSLLELLVEVCLHHHYICFSHGSHVCDATVYLIVLLLHRYMYNCRQKSGRTLQSTFCFDLVEISQNWKQLQHEVRGFSSCSS